MSEEKIDLWSEQGISHVEIRARLTERTDADCLTAFKWMAELGLLAGDLGIRIAEMADKVRSSEAILLQVEPLILEAISTSSELSGFGRHKQATLLELNALMVEAYVRSANQCYPLHGAN